MGNNNNLAEVASIIADSSRASILVSLLDGRMHPASELAYMAGIKPQTASFHLAKMVENNMVTAQKQGRHRYYQLNPDAAGILETLLNISPPVQIKSLKQSIQVKQVKQARTCYDHFAGEFGVALTECMLEQNFIIDEDEEFKLTVKGTAFFQHFGIDLDSLQKKRRAFSRKCLDWSERKFHLAGALGQALVLKFEELHWTEGVKGSRAILVTDKGKTGLKEYFHLTYSNDRDS